MTATTNARASAKRYAPAITLCRFLMALLLSLALFSSPIQANQASSELPELLANLTKTKLSKASKVIDALAEVDDQRVLPIFESMLDGQLYYRKSDRRIFTLTEDKKSEGFYSAVEVLSGDEANQVEKSAFRKIKINNRIRTQLRKYIAIKTLFSEDPKLRLSAVDNMLSSLNDENISLIAQAREKETNKGILKKMDLALTVAQLDSGESSKVKQAISDLSGEMDPVVRNRLQQFREKNAEGVYIEQDQELIDLASLAIEKIESKLKFYGFIERLFFGLSLGSVLLLAAVGLSITFGVMGVINMAHGELLMLGAYTTYVIQQIMPNNLGISIFVSIPVAFLVCGLVGVLIERGVIQFLKGRPLETLLATFGISLILQQAVRSVFSPLNRQVATPEWMSGALEINAGLSLTYNRLYIIIFSLIVFGLLLIVMKRTALGLYVRAVSQNREMAKAVGIRSEWIDAMTFGLGSGIAGVAGVALSQLTNVGPNLGQAYIIDSFMVVVFGGVGNLWGTLVGAFSLGVVSKFLEPLTGTVLAQIFVLIFIVLFIQKRPKGLFPQQGRAAE